jgi:hypothetical protein
MLRILKPGGAILWFDFRVNNPANPHMCGVAAREIRSLFAGCEIALYCDGTAARAAVLPHTLRRPDPEDNPRAMTAPADTTHT